jgi:hypothetical protein
MFTRCALAVAAILFATLTMVGTTAGAVAAASPSHSYTVAAAAPTHHLSGHLPQMHCWSPICR